MRELNSRSSTCNVIVTVQAPLFPDGDFVADRLASDASSVPNASQYFHFRESPLSIRLKSILVSCEFCKSVFFNFEHETCRRRTAFDTNLLVSNLYCGLLMTKSRGRMCIKTLFTQGAILCVCGERKWTLRTTTVTHILETVKRRFRRVTC